MARNPPDLHNWHLLIFLCNNIPYIHLHNSHMLSCCSTIKLTKLFTPRVICSLFHHRLIACLSSGPASCCLYWLKYPERKICQFLPWTHGLQHKVCLWFCFSLRKFPCSITQSERWHILVSTKTKSVPVLFFEKAQRWHLEVCSHTSTPWKDFTFTSSYAL